MSIETPKHEIIYSQIQTIESFLSDMSSIALKLATLIGGSIVLIYCFKIKYFPTDLTLSDTFILISLAIVFGLFYVFTLFTLSFLAELIILFISYLIIKLRNDNSEFLKYVNYVNNRYKTDFLYLFIRLLPAIYFLIVMIAVEFIKIQNLPLVLIVLSLIMLTCDKLLFDLTVSKSQDGSGLFNSENGVRILRYLSIFLVPITFGLLSMNYISLPMKVVKIAEDNVIVHIGKPYDNYLTEYGISKSESSFGSEYVKVENVDILFQGLGENIVLGIKETSSDSDRISLIIPKESVHIINKVNK